MVNSKSSAEAKKICYKCAKPAVLFRDYEGRAYCRGHFLLSVEKRVKRGIRINQMIKPGDRIAVVVDGSYESACALYILNLVVGPRRDASICAISIDLGIEGYSSQAIMESEKLCKKLGIDVIEFSVKDVLGRNIDELKKDHKYRPEEVCGVCGITRRWLLNKKARELGINKICVPDTLEVEAESIMMNYVRGDLPRATRLGAITQYSGKFPGGNKFIPRIKPLRWTPEEETLLYARHKDLPSSAKKCSYQGGLRKDVRKSLEIFTKKDIGVLFTIVSTFDRMLPALRETEKKNKKTIVSCKKCKEPSTGTVCKVCEIWG